MYVKDFSSPAATIVELRILYVLRYSWEMPMIGSIRIRSRVISMLPLIFRGFETQGQMKLLKLSISYRMTLVFAREQLYVQWSVFTETFIPYIFA